jgi:hypothetical protein
MDWIQIYSLIFFVLLTIVMLVYAGVDIEKYKDGWSLLSVFIVIALLAPIVGRIFKFW